MKTINKAVLVLFFTIFANVAMAGGFSLISEDMSGQISNNQVFNGFGCKGKNISPQLKWSNVPEGTKSFAITIYDKDAPTGSGWWHWVVFNIPKNVNSIKAGASLKNMPKGAIESLSDFNKSGFGGACPPKGDKAHQYITTIYALKVEKLNLDKNSNPALVGFVIGANTIAKSSTVSYYKR